MKRIHSQYDNNENEGNDWLVTYADAITLLMTFFVLLLSTATIDQAKYEEVSDGISKGLLHKQTAMPFTMLAKDIAALIKENDLDKTVEVVSVVDGVKIELASELLFKTGSATLKQKLKPVLIKIGHYITSLENYRNLKVDVEGHTDDVPIHTVEFPSNWELSSRRSTNVVRLLIQHGMAEAKIRVVAYAHTRPKLANRDEKKRPIHKHQAANRRVVLYIKRMQR